MEPKVSVIYKETVHQLAILYDEPEANSIANILFEDLMGMSRSQRLAQPDRLINPAHLAAWQAAMDRLANHEPIQQVIGFCHFYGLRLMVNREVLTPRPETEELVDLILRENQKSGLKILDIGTGSGCIALALANNLPGSEVSAWDISKKSLQVARENATQHALAIRLEQKDILLESPPGSWDLIVSNPPYIPKAEEKEMLKNVLDFEPKQALFVPDDDPLLFYRKIAAYGKERLSPTGKIYFEIHEKHGHQVRKLLQDMGFRMVRLYPDMQGKDRMVSAQLN